MTDRIPTGWFDLVHDLRLALHSAHPTAAITEMTADRGWLHVDVDDSQLGSADRLRLGHLVQGFVTQSLHTCGCCGSGHGRDRGERRVVTCDACERQTCDA